VVYIGIATSAAAPASSKRGYSAFCGSGFEDRVDHFQSSGCNKKPNIRVFDDAVAAAAR